MKLKNFKINIRNDILNEIKKLQNKSMRTLGFAYKKVGSSYAEAALTCDEGIDREISIVARSKPDTKMRIVEVLQKNGEVVAVTGDGIIYSRFI